MGALLNNLASIIVLISGVIIAIKNIATTTLILKPIATNSPLNNNNRIFVFDLSLFIALINKYIDIAENGIHNVSV